MSAEKPDPSEELQRLLAEYQTASLATVSPNGAPQASYVPLALDGKRRFLFFVSELSEHTGNLKSNPSASLMLIEDEVKTNQLFARTRATFNGQVALISRDSEEWPEASGAYRERFGKFFDMLSGLPDFHMFALTPEDIRLVIGFGAAYQVTGSEWEQLTLLTGR